MGPVIWAGQRRGAAMKTDGRTHVDGLAQLLGQRRRPFSSKLVVLLFFLGLFPQLRGRRREGAARGRGQDGQPCACPRPWAQIDESRCEFRCGLRRWTRCRCRALQRPEHGGPHVAQFHNCTGRGHACIVGDGKKRRMAVYILSSGRCRSRPNRCVTLNRRSRDLLALSCRSLPVIC